jgi:hypothetical protein
MYALSSSARPWQAKRPSASFSVEGKARSHTSCSGIQRSQREGIGWILFSSRSFCDPPIMIAAHSRPTQPYQQIRRFSRPQRPRNTVSEIDDLIRATISQISDNSFEGRKIAVDVCKDRDTHAISIQNLQARLPVAFLPLRTLMRG